MNNFNDIFNDEHKIIKFEYMYKCLCLYLCMETFIHILNQKIKVKTLENSI